MKYYLAVDIGASGGRHILGKVENGKIKTEEIFRFDNGVKEKNGHLVWDTEALFDNIIKGMRRCAELGKIPESIGIDTWAVDFVLLDKDDKLLGDAVAYRDSRTEGMDREAEKNMPSEELYRRTGIQKQIFNTVYQLMAIKRTEPELLEKAESFLMIPEYLNFRLCGIKKNEYTNASTTALVNAESKNWDMEIIRAMGFPEKLFSAEPALPGTVLGGLLPEIAAEVGFDTNVILPATHDTGSAFLAVPAKDDKAVYISSGTWSLLGVENSAPITSHESFTANFTNEGGYQYRYRYLKNIMGLWMIQSVRNELGRKYSFPELEQMARKEEAFKSIVDVNDNRFLAPHSMTEAVKEYCREHSEPVPKNIGELMQCIYRSLAICYGEAVKELSSLTGKRYSSLNIVGGGSRDSYLNELTAEETGLPVLAGPTEGTALGNLIVQFITGGDIADLQEARRMIHKSFEIVKYGRDGYNNEQI